MQYIYVVTDCGLDSPVYGLINGVYSTYEKTKDRLLYLSKCETNKAKLNITRFLLDDNDNSCEFLAAFKYDE